jgi:hypothetical protein
MYSVCFAAMLLLVVFDLVAADGDDDDLEAAQYQVLAKIRLFASTAALLIASLPETGLGLDDDTDDDERPKRRLGMRHKARVRVRRSVQSIFREHGPYYVRRAYRI